MPFIPTPNTVEAVLNFTVAGTPAANVLNFEKVSGYNQTDLDQLADAIDNWIATQLLAEQNSSVIYQNVTVRGISSTSDLISINTDNSGDPGTHGAGQANNVSKAFTLRTGFTGRSQRGRLFFIGVPNSALDTLDTVSATFVDDVVTILLNLKTIIEALGWIWVVVSKYTNGAPRAVGQTTPVTDINPPDLRVNSQRGRLL